MWGEILEDAEHEVLSSMWPEDGGNDCRQRFNIEKPGMSGDSMDVTAKKEPSKMGADFKRLVELTNYSEKGSLQLAYLAKQLQYKHANAIRLLDEELNILSKQRKEYEFKKLEILKEHQFEEERCTGRRRSPSVIDEASDICGRVPKRRNDVVYHKNLDIDAEYDTITYWKVRALQLGKMLEASIEREQTLMQKFQENIIDLEMKSSPVEDLSQILKRADNFMHFILQTAPVVIGHQDKDLRYRFIYNHFPSLAGEEIIGKTDMEILTGEGIQEAHDFKKEVLERGLPAKREISFNTPLFGAKTFMIYVEPVFSKEREKIGINFLGMDVTDQVAKREKTVMLREEMAVQKAKETELNRTIRITEQTMRAKQLLATMSHEIRSPLTGVVSMAEILAATKMDNEQRQLLDVMISSGDLVLQLINDFLDLSKVESGAMKLEATKFRPREVVRHVLQTAAASLKKDLILEAHVADEVPLEVIGDVLRIRQILTNLISNAIKFTHEGKVGISIQVVYQQCPRCQEEQLDDGSGASFSPSPRLSTDTLPKKQNYNDRDTSRCPSQGVDQNSIPIHKASFTVDLQKSHSEDESTVWLQCNVYDTGIGIPDKALPSLFKKYMQAGADHARKYGGTGLGLAICKHLVELMGGSIRVTSQENIGSKFTFVLPFKVPLKQGFDDADEMDFSDGEALSDTTTGDIVRSFLFKPWKLGESLAHKAKLSGSCNSDCSVSSNQWPDESNLCSNKIPAVAESEVYAEQKCGLEVHGFCSANGSDERTYAEDLDVDEFEKFNVNPRIAQFKYGRIISSRGMGMDVESKLQSTSEIRRLEKENGSTQCLSNRWQHKILIVEDNKINAMVAEKMMKQIGHTIDIVKNGLEAIHALQRSCYDLILMDVCMPVMDGLQATRLIRSFEDHGYWDPSVVIPVEHTTTRSDLPPCYPAAGLNKKRIPIIAMTANTMAESVADCLVNGMDSFVSKPVTFQTLKQCLQQYLPC